MSKQLYIIYIPGLGDEKEPKGQLWEVKRWSRYGVKSELFRMRWGDKKSWQPKFKQLLAKIDELSNKDYFIGLVAASAGASVAINAYAARPKAVNGVVLIAGKVNRPKKIHTQHYIKNPAMPASVKQAVSSLKKLDETKRQHILSRYGLYDGYVKKADSYIPGAHNHVMPTFSHFMNIAVQLILGAPSFIKFLKDQTQ